MLWQCQHNHHSSSLPSPFPFLEEPLPVIQLVRCREELDCHDTMFAVLTRLHLDMEAHKIKDASVHLLHLTWQRDLYPWARVESHEHVADISDICPCPLHKAPEASAKAAAAKAKTKAAGKARAKAKPKAKAKMASRSKPDGVATRLRLELELALGFSLRDGEDSEDENVAPAEDDEYDSPRLSRPSTRF